MKEKTYDVVIIGGGASGLLCAMECYKNGLSVAVLEQSDRIGKKIIASGNGKCNLTNNNLSITKYNSDFANNIISQYNSKYIEDYFYYLGLVTKPDDEGRVYPYSQSSATVVNVLLNKLQNTDIQIFVNFCVQNIIKQDNFVVVSPFGKIVGKNVVMACGSNATFGKASYNLLFPFGHTVTALYPALTPLLCDNFKSARGVRANVRASIFIDSKQVACDNGEVLFKEDGVSGVLAFWLSSFFARELVKNKNSKCNVCIDFVPDMTQEQLIEYIMQNDDNRYLLQGLLHKALCNIILSATPMDRSLLMSYQKASNIAQKCKNYQVEIKGLGAINNAQVICGGLNTNEFDNETLQSKLVKGIYATGEILNVDGECGGYNLHWAWASGLAVAKSIVMEMKND